MDQSTEKPLPTAPAVQSKDDDVRENKDIAAFSYLWAMSLAVFLLRGQSPFVRYHSKQAMLLFFLSIPAWFIPFGIGRLLELVLLGGMVLGFMNAAQGEWKDVPLIGPLSRREITMRQAWKIIVEFMARLAKVLAGLMHSSKNAAPSSPKKSAATAPGSPTPAVPPVSQEPSPPSSSNTPSSPPHGL